MTMDKQPTEARQDELVGIREKIAERECGECYSRYALEAKCMSGYELGKCPGYYSKADWFFSLTVSRGKCPECKGGGMGLFYFNKNAPCDDCHGTGVVEKSIGQI